MRQCRKWLFWQSSTARPRQSGVPTRITLPGLSISSWKINWQQLTFPACLVSASLPTHCLAGRSCSSNRTIGVDETYCLRPIYQHGPVGLLPIQRYTRSIQGHVITPAVNWNAIREHANVPGRTLFSFAWDLVHRGIWQVERFKPSHASRGPHYGTPGDPSPVCTRSKTPFPCSSVNCPCSIVTAGPSWANDPTAVDGIVHWQFAGILRRFTKVQLPLFSTLATNGYSPYRQEPRAALLKGHRDTSYRDLPEPDVAVQKLFTLCPNTYHDGILPLRDCLVKIFQRWKQLGVRRECPYRFSTSEIETHETTRRVSGLAAVEAVYASILTKPRLSTIGCTGNLSRVRWSICPRKRQRSCGSSEKGVSSVPGVNRQ